jgi:hypothetical protein
VGSCAGRRFSGVSRLVVEEFACFEAQPNVATSHVFIGNEEKLVRIDVFLVYLDLLLKNMHVLRLSLMLPSRPIVAMRSHLDQVSKVKVGKRNPFGS